MHSFFHPWTNSRSLHHVIQSHHDVRPDAILKANGIFRPDEDLRLVVGRLKLDPFFADFAQFAERDHLKAAGICEDVPVPAHELMQSSDVSQELPAWLGAQMIGIRQHDPAIQVLHLLASDALHDSLRPHWHVNRGQHLSMRQVHSQGPREAALILDKGLQRPLLLLDLLGEGLVLL